MTITTAGRKPVHRAAAKLNEIDFGFTGADEANVGKLLTALRTDAGDRRIWGADSLGFPVAPQDDTKQNQKPAPAQPLNTHLGRMVACGVISPGTELVAVHHGRDHHAVVEPDGALRVHGDRFGSADEAGKQVRGTRSCQGMAFWHCTTPDGDRLSLRRLRDAAVADGRLKPRRSTRGRSDSG